jgi:hypothetical protein
MAFDQTALDTFYTEVLTAAGGAIAATGTITFSGLPTAAIKATGTIALSGLPLNNDTVTVNGTVVTWKTSGATGNQVNIAGTGALTATALYTFLAASADANIAACTYADNGTGTITVSAKVWGTAGNSITLSESSTNLTVSGANLTGGTAGNTVTVNGAALQFIPASQTSPTSTDVAIGADAATTGTLLKTYLNASANTSIDDATYTDDGAGVVTVTHDTPGTSGNSFTLAKSGANIAVSGANLTGGAATGPYGAYNPVGAADGTIVAVRADSDFEDNLVTVMAVLDFITANTADPSTSSATNIKAKQQRKFIKDVLNAMAQKIKSTVNEDTDTRADDAEAVRLAAVKEFNKNNRLASL